MEKEVLDKTGLPVKVIEQIVHCVAKYDAVERLILYGSRAKGTFKRGSDIDLAVYGHFESPLFIGQLLSELEALPTPYRFDVTDYYQLNHPTLKAHIDQYGLELYRKHEAQGVL